MSLKKTWRKSTVHIQDVATTGDAAANLKDIAILTNIPSGGTGDFLYNLNITRAGVDVTSLAKHSYSTVSGFVRVEDNSTDYVVTDGDVITISGTYA